jgi:PAS domain S-box-containing protein
MAGAATSDSAIGIYVAGLITKSFLRSQIAGRRYIGVLFAGETVQGDHDRFARLDRSVQWLRWLVRPRYEPDRTMGGIVIFSEDITACTLVEDELRHREQRYRSLIESRSDIVWHCRRVGNRIDVPQWYKLTGQTPEQAASNWQDYIRPDDRHQAEPLWLPFIERGGVFKNLYRLRFRDGKYHWVAVNGVSLPEKDGTICEWIGTFNDITDRKLAEEALRQKKKNSEASSSRPSKAYTPQPPAGKKPRSQSSHQDSRL